MQKTMSLREKVIASLIVFMIVFSNFATLGTMLVSYAADDDADITYSAQFVMLEADTNASEEQAENVQDPSDDNATDVVNEQEEQETIDNATQDVSNEQENQSENEIEIGTESETENVMQEGEIQSEETENVVQEQEQESNEEVETTQEPVEEIAETAEVQEGLAIEITLGAGENGYLKSAKVDIKDLANQIFKLRDDISLGNYIESINENKIKLRQINAGTEVKVYLPIELKNDTSIDMTKLQEGVELSLLATYVDNEGNEEIITRSAKPVLNITNDVQLVVDGSVEKFIPYVRDGVNEVLVQLKVVAGSNGKNELPIKDTSIEVSIPTIEGAEIRNVTVSAVSTAYTNGLSDTDVIFTAENWNYQDGKVYINVDNVEKDGKYQKSLGNDEYIISYTYSNCPDLSNAILNSTISAKSNVFNSTETVEVTNSVEKEYNLSQANSNILTYEVTAKTQEMSKGYLYANANASEPEYELEFESALNVNVSRADMINVVEIRERNEYFTDDAGNIYPTSTDNGDNTYYKSVKLNKQNLLSIIGETGNLELLLEDGTSLIQVNKDTEDDGDGYITISFGENKIDKILIRINNPVGEGILNIGCKKAIMKTTYDKVDLTLFRRLNSEFVAAAELQEGIITEMGVKTISTELLDTITNATVSLNRSELSTLVENEDVEINISLNNAVATSDMFKNPVFELVFPEEVQNVEIKDMNLLYGNNELEIQNIETLRNDSNNVVIRLTLSGAQTKYAMGDSQEGTTIILKTNITLDMYRASRDTELIMNYYNEDATNYAFSSDWVMISEPSSYMLNVRQGQYDTRLSVVAPEGFVNAQMISGYKDDKSLISVNQGTKEDSIDTFADARQAEMRMILINNTEEDMNDVHILGRTIFTGNKSIIDGEDLGTNQDAPMISEIELDNAKDATVYYSENGEATDDLEDEANGWTTTPEDIRQVKSYLIVIDGTVEIGSILQYSYDFEIPANLSNNLDLCGTFGSYYTGTVTAGLGEPDKVVLTTGDAPVLRVETTSDTDQATAVPGQRIRYTVKVTNEGRTVSEETVVNSIIPQGTTYIENGELRPDVTELKIEMDNIEPGRSEEATYEVQVNENAVASSTGIVVNSNVEASGLETPIFTDSLPMQVDRAEMSIVLQQPAEGRVIDQGFEFDYNIALVSLISDDILDCTITQNLPQGLEFVDAYVVNFENDGITPITDEKASYDEASRIVTWHLDEIDRSASLLLRVRTTQISEPQIELVSSATITSPSLSRSYTSNEIRHTLARPVIECSYESNLNNKFVKEGDNVEYVLRIKNTGLSEAQNMNVANSLPAAFRVVGATIVKNGVTNSALVGQEVGFNVTLGAGEEAEILLDCNINNLDDVTPEALASNNWTISGNNISTIQTNAVENIVVQNPELTDTQSTSDNANVAVNTNTQPSVNNLVNEQTPVYINESDEIQGADEGTYKILGRAFNDMNQNGQRDDDEEGMANIVAKLCDAETQNIVAQTVTNSIGEYVLENILPGEYYIKFEYDNTKYQVTDYRKQGVTEDRNSDAIISNYKAVTDEINITDSSFSDVDIGLVAAGIFDLSLDVNVNRIVVQDDIETTTYEMENSKLAKVDINPQRLDSSTALIEYTITVANKGEIAGYAKRIVDYLPDDLTLDNTLNPNWYVGADGFAYTQELEDEIINPGETKTITLILTKQMTEDNTGITNNKFEIAQSYNEYAIADIDSTPGNQAEGEDDLNSIDVIIGVQTGGSMINIMIISTTLITLLITLYVIKLRIDKKNKEVII